MAGSEPLHIPQLGPPFFPGQRYFKRVSQNAPSQEAESSDLLRSIRTALRGTGQDSRPQVHTQLILPVDENAVEEELAWDDNTVVWSAGGVQRRKWTFDEPGQKIHYACIGLYLQPGLSSSEIVIGPTIPAAGQSNPPPTSPVPKTEEKSSFSPYATLNQTNAGKGPEALTLTRALYVFMRSMGKMFILNGAEYTFSLPFLVRKAWPLVPHGVIMQRVLDNSELEEAEIAGDFALPTLFTLTSPFAEPRAIGVTHGISGGFAFVAPSLDPTELENSHSRPVKSIPADEHVLWVSERCEGAIDDTLATIDGERKRLTIWHYVYVPPKDIPTPLGRQRARSLNRGRASVSGTVAGELRTAGIATQEQTDRADRMAPLSSDTFEPTQPDFGDIHIPGITQSQSSQSTLLSLSATGTMGSQWNGIGHGRLRRNSLTRTELTATVNRIDRISLNGRSEPEQSVPAADVSRIKPHFWAEKLHEYELGAEDSAVWEKISFALFDQRFDGENDRSLLAVCLPASKTIKVGKVAVQKDRTLRFVKMKAINGHSIASVKATRKGPFDLLVVRDEGQMILLTHGMYVLNLDIREGSGDNYGIGLVTNEDMSIDPVDFNPDISMGSIIDKSKVVAVRDSSYNAVTLVFEDGSQVRTSINFMPLDELTTSCIEALGPIVPKDHFFQIHKRFLQLWSAQNCCTYEGVEFSCFSQAVLEFLCLWTEEDPASSPSGNPWDALCASRSHKRLQGDIALQYLDIPFTTKPAPINLPPVSKFQSLILLGLHTVGEESRLMVHRHQSLYHLVPLVCKLAYYVRPEYVDYWKRLCPSAVPGWPVLTEVSRLNDRLPSWPPDVVATLFGRLCNTDGNNLPLDPHRPGNVLRQYSSTGLGYTEPFSQIRDIDYFYGDLIDPKIPTMAKKSENAISRMVRCNYRQDYMTLMPIGIATPLREAARACQMIPPLSWPLIAYELVGRNDISEGAMPSGDCFFSDGYKSIKHHMDSKEPRKTYIDIAEATKRAVDGDSETVSGTELRLTEFTSLRFSYDKRLQEVQTMLCSAYIPSMKSYDRPELNEHDLAKEHQAHALRVADRTLALPFGRALLTFGSVSSVTKEAYTVPKIELSVRVQPQNTVVGPEPGKVPNDAMQWAEFHNGTAAALRISPSSGQIDSSWITFNRPDELTPEHAGFLFGLGLTGHLKNMLSWHTFGYLTPKHDFTSIGVLLGLAAAHAGTASRHVSKLLAVHTPALLPVPDVDLNIPLLTQAAGLVGAGVLYLGTRDSHLAEVALQQISRHDLLEPTLYNEHREAYTTAAGLAFGMVMVGKGSKTPNASELHLLQRLRVLIHGELLHAFGGKQGKPTFDTKITSPAASIALGLMYLKTNRKDVADILTIPDTVVTLNHLQPNHLMTRAIARGIIMWDSIRPDNMWLKEQVPDNIGNAMVNRLKGHKVDDALELAYYHVLAGACFAMGLKYAGTANSDAFHTILPHHDLYTRLHHGSGGTFDSKIKRAAIRDGLNQMSLALNMIMAGTGDLNALRRARFAHGACYSQGRYGCHVAVHMSLGMLFLGGGRYTIGTSDASIAVLTAAFFPRFPPQPSDSKCFLPALRHLWVLAVEPRCLIARDVDTKEIVSLPVKIRVKDGPNTLSAQFMSPTLLPELDRLVSIKVDTPRYWPLLLDASITRHRESLLHSQTIMVKRRTAFLSYVEDPKGSRSLLVRSGASTGEAAQLDFPQLKDPESRSSDDLHEVISSFANEPYFLAFADRFCRDDGATEAERTFQAFCHAALLDCMTQDKPTTLQTHLLLYRARIMPLKSRYFPMMIQDLRFIAEYYSKTYERRFSGRFDNGVNGGALMTRPPLVRESQVLAALHTVDEKLLAIRQSPEFVEMLRKYVKAKEPIVASEEYPDAERHLAWYLLRENVPSAMHLRALHALGSKAYRSITEPSTTPPTGPGPSDAGPAEGGTPQDVNLELLEDAIKLMMNTTGAQLVSSGWTASSLEEIMRALAQPDGAVEAGEVGDVSMEAEVS